MVVVHPEDQVGFPGRGVTFCCKGKGDPAPNIEWYAKTIFYLVYYPLLRVKFLFLNSSLCFYKIFIHSFIHSFIYSFIHSLVCLFSHLLLHYIIYANIFSVCSSNLVCSSIFSLIYYIYYTTAPSLFVTDYLSLVFIIQNSCSNSSSISIPTALFSDFKAEIPCNSPTQNSLSKTIIVIIYIVAIIITIIMIMIIIIIII